MGDIADLNDLERLLRSQEGRAFLETIRQSLVNRTIVNVDFTNEVHFITTTLLLEDGTTVSLTHPDLDIGNIRKQFEAVLDREYYVDFPERKPTT